MHLRPKAPSKPKPKRDPELDALYGPLEAALNKSDRALERYRAKLHRARVAAIEGRTIICKSFRDGDCKYGDDCVWSHDLSLTTRTPNRVSPTSTNAQTHASDYTPPRGVKREHSPDPAPSYRQNIIALSGSYKPSFQPTNGWLERRIQEARRKDTEGLPLSRRDRIALGKFREREKLALGRGETSSIMQLNEERGSRRSESPGKMAIKSEKVGGDAADDGNDVEIVKE